MKRYLKLLFCSISVTLLMSSCSFFSSDLPQQGGNSDNSEYYVQYSIKSTYAYYYFGDIYYAAEHGTQCAEKGRTVKSWSVIVGPVKRGFRASVRYDSGVASEVKIEVSKNGSPFALKASGEKSASYTINY